MSVEVLTFGCRLNAVESEAMRGLAERAGHRGVVLVNTCAVTAEAEKQARKAIRAAHRRNPGAPILVTGCAAQIAPEAWASLPGVARVVPNSDKLRPEAWAPSASAPPSGVARGAPEPAEPPRPARTPDAPPPSNGIAHAAPGAEEPWPGAPEPSAAPGPGGGRPEASACSTPEAGRPRPGVWATGASASDKPRPGALALDAHVRGKPRPEARASGAPPHSSGAARAAPGLDQHLPEARTAPTPFAAGPGEGRTRAFLQIQGGCDHACTFCVIPQGRGPSFSVPPDALAARLRRLVEAGHKEAVLTGVDIASYGADLPGRPTLGAAVRRLLALVPELPRLRLSSLDPAALDDDLWRLLAEEPRLMPHLHLSLQHGADLILKRMRRRHGRADALRAARRARDARQDVALGADLIAGFPTETEAHHRDTLDLVEAMGLAFLHVFPYSERPGTPAARMPHVPAPLRRERAARLREAGAAAAARFYAGRVGREEVVLFEAGNRGHTEHFVPLRLAEAAAPVPRGELRRVRATAATTDGLLATGAGEAP